MIRTNLATRKPWTSRIALLNFLIGLTVGSLLGGVAVGTVLYKSNRANYERGHHVGYVEGGLYIIQQLDKHFSEKTRMTGTPTNVLDTIEFKDRLIRVKKEGETLTVETL